jgi:hypothetical protein
MKMESAPFVFAFLVSITLQESSSWYSFGKSFFSQYEIQVAYEGFT